MTIEREIMMGKENSNFTEEQIAYLQMIQSTIDRMSGTSAIFKGFCAAIITGVSAVSFTDINNLILLLALLPVLCFLIVDMYYFHLEKRFRLLYEQVRRGQHSINFDLTPPKINGIKSYFACLKSPAILLFYVPAIIISAMLLVFKFKGGI